MIETQQQPARQQDDGTIVVEAPATTAPKVKPSTAKGQQKPQQPAQQKGKTPQKTTPPKAKTPAKAQPQSPKRPTTPQKIEDTGIDFKDDLGQKGKKPTPKTTPKEKQKDDKTPAKPKRKENDPDDEYYDLEGF